MKDKSIFQYWKERFLRLMDLITLLMSNLNLNIKVIMLLLVNGLISIFIICLFLIYVSEDILQQEIIQKIKAVFIEKSRNIEGFHGAVLSMAQEVSKDNQSAAERDEKIAMTLSTYPLQKDFIQVDILRDGALEYHYGKHPFGAINKRQLRKIEKLAQEGVSRQRHFLVLGMEDSIDSQNPERRNITYLYMTSNSQNQVDSITLISYQNTAFYHWFHTANYAQYQMILLDRDNRFVFHQSKDKLGLTANYSFLPRILEAEGDFTASDNETGYRILYSKVGQTDWVMLAMISEKDLFNRLSGLIQLMVVVLSIYLVLLFLSYLLISKILVLPIKTITERFKKLKEGYISRNIRLEVRSRDELGELANLFNTFLDILKDKENVEDELKNKQFLMEELNGLLDQMNQELEQRIKLEVDKNRDKDHIMIQQSKQAAMGEMIGNIAHQWRQPLNAIGILIQDLGDAYQYNELSEEYLKKSIAQAMKIIAHMSQTIDDFRNFFKPEKEKIDFNVKETVHKAISFVEASFKNNNIEINLDLVDNIVVQGYPNEYSQVILNILNNAKDAFFERSIENPVVTLKLTMENERSVLSILDNAGGIAQEIIDKIFEPYFTTKEQGKGTGVGLYMSKMIIEKSMGGTITVRNNKDGAEFIIIV